MRSTRNVVEPEQNAGMGHYSDPPLLVLASLANGPKHGHAMIEDIERLCGTRLGPGTLYGAIARLLTRLYPSLWRDRYGAEFEAFLQTGQGGLRTSVNVVWSALWEHIVPTQGGNMDPNPNSFRAILKHPS